MREIYLPCGRVTLISDVDYPFVSRRKWYASDHNSMRRPYVRDTKTDEYLHRIITKCPPNFIPDHRDGDSLNNQRWNLRISTYQQNKMNHGGHSLSGYKGVSWDRTAFRVRINVNGEQENLGRFKTAIEAAKCYDAKAFEMFGEFAWLNFPEDFPLPKYDEEKIEIPF